MKEWAEKGGAFTTFDVLSVKASMFSRFGLVLTQLGALWEGKEYKKALSVLGELKEHFGQATDSSTGMLSRSSQLTCR